MRKIAERQVFVTWYTPEEKMPKEDEFVVVTISGEGPYITYDHALMTAAWLGDEGWYVEGIDVDTKEYKIHAWCDLEPYGG